MLAQRLLVAAALSMMALEVIDAFAIDVPAAALVFAVLFGAGALWFHRRRGIAAVILLTLLFAVEVVGIPFYDRTGVSDWLMQLAAGAVSATGLAAAVAVLVRRERRRTT